MFFSLQNLSLLFSITRSSSFSVIHVSVNIKNNVEKDTTLLLFFLSKSPGGHAIFFQIKPLVAFGLPYLLIKLFYIGMSVVRTDGRALGWCRVTWLPNFLGWVVYHIFLHMVLCCARFARESSAINLVKILVCAIKIVEWPSLPQTGSCQSSVNRRPPFWILFKKTSDLAARLHLAPIIYSQGVRIWLLFHRKFINCLLKHCVIWKQGQFKY